MANSKKTKYPLDRAKLSGAFANDMVFTDVHKTNPLTIVRIHGLSDENIVSDIQNAIDEVLKYHGK